MRSLCGDHDQDDPTGKAPPHFPVVVKGLATASLCA